MTTEFRRPLIMSNSAQDQSSQKQPDQKPGKHHISKPALIRAYSDYRHLQSQISMYTYDDDNWTDEDAIAQLTNDFQIAWGKYWDVCARMSQDRFKEFRGRKRNLRYALVKHGAGNREKLLRLDPEYLKRERLPLPGVK
jgi:hypothetical protein